MRITQFKVPNDHSGSVIVEKNVFPFFYNFYHSHSEAQITYVLEGDGTLTVGNYTQNFQPGEIFFFDSNVPHHFQASAQYFKETKSNGCKAIHVYFDYNQFRGFHLPEFDSINKFIEMSDISFQVSPAFVDNIALLILSIYESSGLKRLMHSFELLDVLSLSITSFKSLSTGFYRTTVCDKDGIRMNTIYNYSMAHYQSDIMLEEIASQVHLTPTAFCKYFKRCTNKTYVQFLNEIRINEACERIIQGDEQSLSSIAYETGFNNPVTFNRVFKKLTGQTPSDFASQHRKNRNMLLKYA